MSHMGADRYIMHFKESPFARRMAPPGTTKRLHSWFQRLAVCLNDFLVPPWLATQILTFLEPPVAVTSTQGVGPPSSEQTGAEMLGSLDGGEDEDPFDFEIGFEGSDGSNGPSPLDSPREKQKASDDLLGEPQSTPSRQGAADDLLDFGAVAATDGAGERPEAVPPERPRPVHPAKAGSAVP